MAMAPRPAPPRWRTRTALGWARNPLASSTTAQQMSGLTAPAGAWTPLADVSESEDAFHIGIELPGVKSKDIAVEANGPELVVTGDIKERGRKGVLRRSTRHVGAFEYRLRLPGELDTHKIKADSFFVFRTVFKSKI